MTSSLAQFWWHQLPPVNAALNGASAVLLLCAFVMIKRGRVTAHATLIICALVTSTAFLACYLTYHILKGRHDEPFTPFPAGRWHPWYMALLGSHTVLAVVILPLIAASLWYAWKRRWHSHHKVASITFPLWFYVSVTGVMVYWMLYHFAPTLK
jgi:uncharacterized membrane protein YozB (DUF420 family)